MRFWRCPEFGQTLVINEMIRDVMVDQHFGPISSSLVINDMISYGIMAPWTLGVFGTY